MLEHSTDSWRLSFFLQNELSNSASNLASLTFSLVLPWPVIHLFIYLFILSEKNCFVVKSCFLQSRHKIQIHSHKRFMQTVTITLTASKLSNHKLCLFC